jgi:PBP1b-binding outer membrane lipoprotein LpoB
MKNISKYILLLMSTLTFAACTGYDEYRKYLGDGERIYPQKPDSLKSFPGDNRVMLRWMLIDPNVQQCEISWVQNNEVKTKQVDVTNRPADNIVEVVVDQLDETNYVFGVTSVNEYGNRSVSAEVEETVFGDIYKATLVSRMTKSVSRARNVVTINWYNPITTETGIEISYSTVSEGAKKVIVPLEELETVLTDVDATAPVSYRTMFKPEADVIDTFYTEPVVLELPPSRIALDRLKFRAATLPGDEPDAWGWVMPNIWDGLQGEPGFHTAISGRWPHMFTIDLGVEANLNLFKFWQRGTDLYSFDSGNIRKFKIWGSLSPNPDGSLDDSWTLLGSFESVKPSGLPIGQLSDADRALVRAGEEFVISADTTVRYVRIEVTESWSGQQYFFMTEVAWWASDVTEL